MSAQTPLRVVIDTNVVFEGVTKQGGAAGLVLGQASFAEIEQVMAARDKAEPEEGLTPEVI